MESRERRNLREGHCVSSTAPVGTVLPFLGWRPLSERRAKRKGGTEKS